MTDPTQTTSTLVLHSGGLDSTVLLTEMARTRVRVEALTIHGAEQSTIYLAAAAAVAEHLGIRHDVVDLGANIVANRNAIMLMVAAGIAASRNLDQIATAVHAGDHTLAECRPAFIAAADVTAQLGTDDAVSIAAPYLRLTKSQIVQRGQAMSAPMRLAWSCREDADAYESASHCGRCAWCIERAEAFHLARVDDPTYYVDREYWRAAVGA